MKVIEVVISPTGNTEIHTKGFSGTECQQASQFLERALGTTIRDRTTAEFHEINTANQVRQDTK